ncbi:DUF1643 domain-containing protein [Aureimonas phyllosphaerae]|uniref:DUF1643 domain-containing protein n=1 Tax=Aureimonas phyllosphaerae TaxID=1166078 RepID=A0A7W6BVK3_9HYPH|nr:DUF1643 domain-containing protein [Aureimonas phyllosphaerae]MBB3937717.1 hypothetical protein [Aureimonas phyllosphaerae]MBB3961748.1 hypothetical protein [Aureimonas phyllosphaerae]SFF45389.1 hypothetical protein SAMN05216566_11455 [Aureimonas phyllosphaerae]
MTAVFSSCRTWRYRLERVWDAALPRVAFILLNPSTADETNDDPTIRRCIGYARAWGMGSLVLGNIFAYRSTSPFALREVCDPIGPDNDQHLAEIAVASSIVVCGWGAHGRLHQRDRRVVELIAEAGGRPHALRLTNGGEPGHPLYLRKDLQPRPYTMPREGFTR